MDGARPPPPRSLGPRWVRPSPPLRSKFEILGFRFGGTVFGGLGLLGPPLCDQDLGVEGLGVLYLESLGLGDL